MINKNIMLYVVMGYEIVLILKNCYELVNKCILFKCY